MSLGARFRPCRQRVSSAWSEVRSSGHGYLEHLDSQDQVECLVTRRFRRLPLRAHSSTIGLAIRGRLDRVGALEAVQRQMRRQAWSRHCGGAMCGLSCGQRRERDELQLVSNTKTSSGLEGEKMMKWPLVKLLSINTSVGLREQAAGRVDCGPVARLNQHRRRVSSSPANVPKYQPETQMTYDIEI